MDDSQCQLAAERVVLSTTFATRNLRMLRVLDEKDFTDQLHKLLLKAFKELRKRDAPLEQKALDSLLRTPDYDNAKTKRLCGVNREESLPAAAQLVLLEFSNPANLEYYFRVIRQDRMRRALFRLGTTIHEKARNKPLDPMDTIAWVAKEAKRLTRESGLQVEK